MSANGHQVGTKLKVVDYCKYRIFRLISRYGHELSGNMLLPLWFDRIRVHAHTNARQFMSAHAHATVQRVLDFPTLLRKNGFVISMQCSTMLKKQPNAQSHALVITAYANKPLCLLHVHHYSKCTAA